MSNSPSPPKHSRHSLSLQRPIKPTPSLLREDDRDSVSSFHKPSQYEEFLSELEKGASLQFRNVLNILTTDSELQPLILDHRKLLLSLKTSDVKAEQMLAIISAAESEMYESSKELQEKQALITQLQLEREENERLNQKLKTIEEEESKSRRLSRIEHQEIIQLRQLLGIDEEPGADDESVGSSFHRSIVAAVEALKEEAKESEARADHLREKMKELAQLRQASISILEEKLKKANLREVEKNQEIAHLRADAEQLTNKVKELNTELQAVRFERQHLLEELENQQRQLRGITGGTGSFLQQFDDLQQELSVQSSLLPEVTVPTPEGQTEELKEEIIHHYQEGSSEQIPAPPPLRGLVFRRSVPNSVRRQGSPLYLPHPPMKTPSPRHLSKENISSNRPLTGAGVFWTQQKGRHKDLEHIISQQSNQLVAASYELDKIGRERYYEAKLSEQKQHYSQQQTRQLQDKMAMVQEENVELKLKLKEIKAQYQEQLKKTVQKLKTEMCSQNEITLQELYRQIFELKERGIVLKQKLNQERKMRIQSESRLSKAEEEALLIRERFKQQARFLQFGIEQEQRIGRIQERRALTPQPRTKVKERVELRRIAQNPLKKMEFQLVVKQLSSVLQAANRREPFVLNLGRFLTDALLLKYILPSIHQNLFIFELNLSSINLSDSAISKLCSTLNKDTTLRCLRLAHNRCISSTGFSSLAKLLKLHPSLRTLDLSDTNLFSEGREVIISFPLSPQLDQLILQELLPIGTGEESLSLQEKQNLNELMESIYKSKLRKLNISDNQFAESTLKVLIQSLPRDSIQKLFINRVRLQAPHLPYLCSFIGETASTIKSLHLSGNSLGSTGLGSLFSSASKALNLADIDVSEQKPFFMTALVSLNPESLLPLGSVLSRMRRLYLNGLNLGDQNGLQLMSSSSRILNLQILELSQNRLTHSFIQGLMKLMMDYQIELQGLRSQEGESELISSQNQSRVRLPTLSSSPIVGGGIGGLTGSEYSIAEQQAGTEQVHLHRVDTMAEETEQQESEATDGLMDITTAQAASLQPQSQGRGLEILVLARNPLKSAGAQILAEMITFATLCKKLRRLDLEKCELGDEGVEALESANVYRKRHLVKEKGFTRLRVNLENNEEE